MTVITLQKWGNSQGFRIPKALLESMDWEENKEFSLTAQQDKLIIEPIKKRKTIQELFDGFNGEYEPIEMDWGETCGKEIW